MRASAPLPVFVDARPVQDPAYSYRGVGQHVAAVLRERMRVRDCCVTGLIDPALPPIPKDYRDLCNRYTPSINQVIPASGAIYLHSSPMTCNIEDTWRFVAHPRLLTAALVYDFIPLDRTGYFLHTKDRIDYAAKLARLKSCQLFFPISEYTATRLREVLGISPERIRVTGASVRATLFREAALLMNEPYDIERPYFLTIGGGDRRKNTETAVRAVAELNATSGYTVALVVVGRHSADYAADLRNAAGSQGDGSFLQFASDLPDAGLARLYRGAVATIVPSHMEGFSLPVVESAVCGTPVVASDNAAHRELVPHDDQRFEPNDSRSLCRLLHRLLTDWEHRQQVLKSQTHLADKFDQASVARRVWQTIEETCEARTTGFCINAGSKPTIAVLSPYPPEASGCAEFTRRTVEELSKRFDVCIYSDSPRPLQAGPYQGGESISCAALLKNRYDAIISVIGNSHFHNSVIQFATRFGGPAVLHDSRLTHYYHFQYGAVRFRRYAEELLGRGVTSEEVNDWLADRNLPTLFLEDLLLRANPLVVHTRQAQQLIAARYGYEPCLALFPPNVALSNADRSIEAQLAARARLGIPARKFVIASFGYVSRVKAISDCVRALGLVCAEGLDAELHLVGSSSGLEHEIRKIAGAAGVADRIVFHECFLPRDRYVDYLIAADAAVQLRTYSYGQPSAGLADCLGAGLPVVTNQDLAEACDAPAYAQVIPNKWTMEDIASALIVLHRRGLQRADSNIECERYNGQHNFVVYSERLSQILGFA